MNGVKGLGMLMAIILTLFLSVGSAQAIVISYEVTNLADVVDGEDLWEYTYTVSDHTFAADTGFVIYFDLGMYSNIQDPAPIVNGDWDILTFQPDPDAYPIEGMYDAYALADGASLDNPFTINFVWLGQGVLPGAQIFDLYDGLTWEVLETGHTSAPVPEPATLFLLASGLAGLVGLRRKRIK